MDDAQQTASLFDLNGTLVDSIYQHVARGMKRSNRSGSREPAPPFR
jgi:beta-phosphoglucomutase-like phosphatase (HAD superfamily)